jgi:hypothetical protein
MRVPIGHYRLRFPKPEKPKKNPEVEEEEERDRVRGLYDFPPFVFGLKCPSEVEMPPTCTVCV